VWGRTQGEIAEEMSVKPSKIGSVLPQVEQAWQNRVKNELKEYFPAKIEGGEYALRRHPLGHIDIPEDFDVSRFANHFVMNATRLNHLISRKDGIPDSLFMRLMEEMDRAFREAEKILSLPMATGPMLGFCRGSEVASLVDVFAKVGRLPGKNFMRALETVAEKHGRGQPGYSDYWCGTQLTFMKAAQHFLDTEKKSGKHNIDPVYYKVLSYT
jgi:hypothetical protein